MKKIILLAALFVLFMYTVEAIPAGENYNFTKVPECFGDITIKVRAKTAFTTGEYNIANCNRAGTDDEWQLWKCHCGFSESIFLETNANTTNNYDIVVEYYIEPVNFTNVNETNPTKIDIDNHSARRTLNFNNLSVGPFVEKKIFKMPEFSGGYMIATFITAIVAFIAAISWAAWYWLYNDKENKVGYKPKPKEEKQMTKEEIDELLRNNV